MGRKLPYKLQSGRPFTHFYSFFWLWSTGLYSCLTTWVTHFSKLSNPPNRCFLPILLWLYLAHWSPCWCWLSNGSIRLFKHRLPLFCNNTFNPEPLYPTLLLLECLMFFLLYIYKWSFLTQHRNNICAGGLIYLQSKVSSGEETNDADLLPTAR